MIHELKHLDYCDALYLELPLKIMWILQLVQNKVAGELANIPEQIVASFDGLPFCSWTQFSMLLLGFWALNELDKGT